MAGPDEGKNEGRSDVFLPRERGGARAGGGGGGGGGLTYKCDGCFSSRWGWSHLGC